MKIIFSVKFEKEYSKVPKKIARQFDKRLTMFIANQGDEILKNHGLKGRWRGCRSINITGDWRAIYEEKEDLIVFVALGTHSQLYG